MEQSDEVKLAYEIAEKLNDLKSIDWHLGNPRRYPEWVILAALKETFNGNHRDNPAAYYNKALKRHGNKRPRN